MDDDETTKALREEYETLKLLDSAEHSLSYGAIIYAIEAIIKYLKIRATQ